MKTLETEFGYAGHYLRQIWRQDDVAIYERSRSKGEPAHELELIVIRIKPESKTPSGSIVLEHEAYPSGSEWGRFGWSFPLRHKIWVLGLAEKLLAIKHGAGEFVRQATSQYKKSQKFAETRAYSG